MPRKAKPSIQPANVPEYIPQFWGMLTAAQQNTFLTECKILSYNKNGIIYDFNEQPTDVFCLLQGEVKILKEGKDRNQIIRIIGNIGFFGYRAYWANEIHKTQAQAVEFAVAVSIPMILLTQFAVNNGKLALFFLQQMAIEQGASDERFTGLTQKHLRGRLAESLCMLKNRYGLEEDGYTLSIYLSREDLANLSNMTTANAIRTLTQLVEEGVIAVDGRKIKMLDEDKLRHISFMG